MIDKPLAAKVQKLWEIVASLPHFLYYAIRIMQFK
jgi:hypothetical protein